MEHSYLSELLCNEHGHVMEIGAGEGYNTSILCDLPEKEKVIVIDPFEICWNDDDIDTSYVRPYPYQRWVDNTIKHQIDKILLIQKRSDDETVFDDLKDLGRIVFCFVDGLQKEENIINDLSLLDRLKVKYICLDDWDRESELSQVKAGTMKFLEINDKYDILKVSEIGESGLSGYGRTVSFLRRIK